MGNNMDKNTERYRRKKERKDPYLLVVAIDFGTSYSGYAYSTRSDFLTDPNKVFTVQPFSQSHLSLKTPTYLLVNEKKEFVAFGCDAENEYAQLCASSEQSKYLFFPKIQNAAVSSGDCGGTSVDTEFLKVMKQLLGDEIDTEFKTSDPESFLDLLRSFETIKRTIKTESEKCINVRIPSVALSKFCQLKYNKSFEAQVDSSELKASISVKNDHLRIKSEFLRGLFVKTLTDLNNLISSTFKQDRVRDVKTIVLVGGFASCALVQDSVKSKFSTKRVIIPEECGLAVLKGAVMFGHNSSFVSLRVLPFTVGIQACKPYNKELGHDRVHVFRLNGKEYSRNLFHIIVKRDTDVEIDTDIVKEFSTSKPNQEFIRINIYATKEKNITYVDHHDCHFLGRSVIKVAQPSKKLQNVKVVFTFGNTEMSVTAHDPGNDDKYEGQLDLFTENNDDETPDIILDE